MLWLKLPVFVGTNMAVKLSHGLLKLSSVATLMLNNVVPGQKFPPLSYKKLQSLAWQPYRL